VFTICLFMAASEGVTSLGGTYAQVPLNLDGVVPLNGSGVNVAAILWLRIAFGPATALDGAVNFSDAEGVALSDLTSCLEWLHLRYRKCFRRSNIVEAKRSWRNIQAFRYLCAIKDVAKFSLKCLRSSFSSSLRLDSQALSDEVRLDARSRNALNFPFNIVACMLTLTYFQCPLL
jgi:hypothetical protein